MFLIDDYYEDENGRQIRRHEIECLGTYKTIVDGFFTWCCGDCGKEDSTRAFRIGGTVRACSKCKKKNLLIRTDFKYMNQKMMAADRNDTAAEKAIAVMLGG